MPVDHSAMDGYLGRARGVLIAVSDLLPVEVLHGAKRLIDHGEPAEGLVEIAWVIRKSDARVPHWVVTAIRDMTADLIPEAMLPQDLDRHIG